MSQLTLDFDASLTSRYRSLREAAAHAVYGSRKGLSGVAADLDMSPSDLTKRLNPDGAEPRPLRADDVEAIIKSTGDTTPIAYLIARFMQTPDAQRQAAVQTIANLLPVLTAAVEAAGISSNVSALRKA